MTKQRSSLSPSFFVAGYLVTWGGAGMLAFLIASAGVCWAGALRMGAKHGAWCVGCCWALMVSLFALGAVSIAWMAFVAGQIAPEEHLPWRRVATYGTAAVLLALWRARARDARRYSGPHDPRTRHDASDGTDGSLAASPGCAQSWSSARAQDPPPRRWSLSHSG
jgi:predicted metal-binding membrane protein